MPASTLDPVNAALRTALTKTDGEISLDTQLAGSTKKALLSNIEFEPAGSYQSTVLDKLKSKYIVLKSSDTPQPSKPEEEMGANETLKLAKYELYPVESVQLGWKNCDWSVGAGMVNMGNTCYLNSTLQALFHVPALANWLMSDKEHLSECQDSGVLCIICAMRKTLQDSQQRNANAIRPLLIYNKLRLVCRNLIPGRQEDAHEFLRYLVEAMEKSYLSRFKNSIELDAKIKETTPLNQILGGYLRSAVRCLKCGHVSTTFQHFQDLLLDIRKATNLDEAMELYFSRERLDDEGYHCEACQKKVPATKQFSLERAPMVLCIQLKRFSMSNNKITKHLQFRQRLDITKYARHRPNVPLIYRLVALVTHMGPTVSCGHYTAVAQVPSGNFYQFDDSMVRPISHQAVFNTNAYIMLYELESSPFAQKSATPTKLKNATSSSSIDKSPCTSSTNNNSTKTNGNTANQTLSNGSSNVSQRNNGVGFTSDKVYGPELPPARMNQKPPSNGIMVSSSTNGNGKSNNQSSSNSDSDEPDEIDKKSIKVSSTPSTRKKEADTSSSNNRADSSSSNNHKSPSNSNSRNSSPHTSISSLSSPETPRKPLPPKSLVPYDAGDSSEDSNHSEVETRVSTKAAVGEWLVTSSTDVAPGTDGKPWNKPAPNLSSSANTGSSVVSELFKMSHEGYSAPVSSWNGTRSHLEKEITNDRREERKRALQADSSDEGRVKHVKVSSGYKSNPGYNPIQEYHNAKNWSHNSSHHYGGGGRKAFYGGGHNRHRRNFGHKNNHYNHKNNHRFRQ